MNVVSMTASAISHGLARGRHSTAGLDAGSLI